MLDKSKKQGLVSKKKENGGKHGNGITTIPQEAHEEKSKEEFMSNMKEYLQNENEEITKAEKIKVKKHVRIGDNYTKSHIKTR